MSAHEDSSNESSTHSDASTRSTVSQADTTLTSIASTDASTVTSPHVQDGKVEASNVQHDVGHLGKSPTEHTLEASTAVKDVQEDSSPLPLSTEHPIPPAAEHGETSLDQGRTATGNAVPETHDTTATANGTLPNGPLFPDLGFPPPPPPLPSTSGVGLGHDPLLPSSEVLSMLSTLKLEFSNRYYDALGPPPPSSVQNAARDSAREQAPLRSLQYMQYVGQMEDRVRSLESELNDLRDWRSSQGNADASTTKNEQPDATVPPIPPVPGTSSSSSASCEHKSLTYKQFLQGDDLVKFVICTLPEEQEMYNHRAPVNQPRPETSPHEAKTISRMCIRSPHIIDFLAKSLPEAAPEERSCIFVKPFKPFCLLENDIREYATLLKAKVDKLSEPKSSTEEGDPASATAGLETAAKVEGPSSHMEEMVDGLSDTDLPTASAHFQLLLSVMDGELKHQLQRHRECRRMDLSKPPQVSFTDLWHIFQPGQLIYQQTPNRQAYMVINVTGGRRLFKQSTIPLSPLPPLPDPTLGLSPEKAAIEQMTVLTIQNQTFSSFQLDCVYLDTEGHELIFVPKTITIPYFSEVRDIRNLDVTPLDLAPDVEGQSCNDYLLARGGKFVELTKATYAHRDYKGPSLPQTTFEGTPVPREQIDSQVIIDFEHAYLSTGEKSTYSRGYATDAAVAEIPEPITVKNLCLICSTCSASRLNGYDDSKLDQAEGKRMVDDLEPPRNSESITQGQRMILPGHVYGYVLRNLRWFKLDVHLLQAPKKSANFDDLVLPAANKALVKSLVKSRQNTRTKGLHSDVVRGKGQGIIILLHGVPGTGKSSTAECVADSLGCPLFTVTCGNIGTDASVVETKLQEMFYMAQKWNCVMLLDEADVFLQERNATDIKRNAVVSVFLRALEYFGGVLFLTTNKVGKFDEAFVSRIHQAIEYPKLDIDVTRSIWEVNLRKLKQSRNDIVFDEAELLRLAEKSFKLQNKRNKGITWNGRQIRNAFQTAIALAEDDDHPTSDKQNGTEKPVVRLESKHFKQVLHVSDNFDQYLLRTRHGRDYHFLAQQKQDRADSRGPERRETKSYSQSRRDKRNSGYSDSDDSDITGSSQGYDTPRTGHGRYRDQGSKPQKERPVSPDQDYARRERKRRADGSRREASFRDHRRPSTFLEEFGE